MIPSLASSPSLRLLRSLLLGGACLASFACADSSSDGTPADGTPRGGTSADGTPRGGTSADGTPRGGTSADGTPADGTPRGGSSSVEGPAAPASCSPGECRLGAIGVQLYTVRAAMEADFEGTLRRLAQMGYREVEFAGLFGRDPAQVRSLLAELNLTAVGSHVDWSRFRDDPTGAIDETLALGAEYLVFPWMPESERQTLEQWHGWAARLNEVAAASRARGLPVAYHNHDFEFTVIAGELPYDVLVAELNPALVDFELDLYWLRKAGVLASALFDASRGVFLSSTRRTGERATRPSSTSARATSILPPSSRSGPRAACSASSSSTTPRPIRCRRCRRASSTCSS